MKKTMTVLLSICTFLAAADNGKNEHLDMKIIAHRGGASLGPENTLTCIQKGILTGVDAIEVDVHLSADGYVVVCHDESIDRTTDGSGRIENLTLEQIKSARIADGTSYERVPTLEEVLTVIKDRCILLLEIKKTREDQYPLIEDKIVALLDQMQVRDQVVVQSFNDSVLERFHSIAPDIPLEKLLVCRLPFGLAYDMKIRRFSMEDYPHVRSFNTYNSFTSQRFIRDAHRLGKTVRVWTVDNPSKVKKNVDAVITNCPQFFVPAGE